MRNIPVRLWLIVSLSIAALAIARAEGQYTDREILIRFKTTTTETMRTNFERAESLLFVQEIPTIKVRLYQLPAVVDVQAAVTRYQSHPLVEFAEPNYNRNLTAIDPDLPLQWSLNNTGQTVNGHTGPAGIDIRWAEAILRLTAPTQVTVAVIDTGVAMDHPEIFGDVWNNKDELNGRSGVDDDRNGYTDDSFGYDFYALDVLPLDENGHGTLVASIIAGVPGNGIGGYGICPTAKVMTLRVLDQFGRGGLPKFARVSDVALALDYARRNGARIANLSLGGYSYSATEYLMIESVSSAGVLIVAAAGNGGGDGIGDNNDRIPVYPASYPVSNLISVAAQDRSGGLAWFSNYGATSVHIAAPGTDIRGADVTRHTVFSEDFETGAVGWTVGAEPGNRALQPWSLIQAGGTHAVASNALGDEYAPYTNIWVRSPRIELSGVHGARLSFYLAHDLADDRLLVEASSDGFTWTEYGRVYGSSLYNEVVSSRDVDLADFDGGVAYFRFRLSSDYSIQGLGVFIDDISVTGITLFDPSAPKFRFNDGTSFAAPIVSGVAALVMAERPDLTAAQVKSILLASARPLTKLSGKVATGGMVDAEAAVQMAQDFGTNAPTITSQPQSKIAAAGSSVTLSITATGTPSPTIQWQKNGAAITGATASTLTLSDLMPSDAGSYTCVLTNAKGTVVSSTATLAVNYSRLSNLSVRTNLARGQQLIVGFVTNGDKSLLVRGIGPTLGDFHVSGFYADPRLELYRQGGPLIDANDDWGGTKVFVDAFNATGAFSLPAASKDAVLLRQINGAHSAVLKGDDSGVVLVEVYDALPGYAERLVNVSARNRVGSGDDVMIAGFVIDSNTPKKLLIRGCGPKLAGFGVPNTLVDPKLEVISQTAGTVATNDNWSAKASDVPALQAAFKAAGAFDFDLNSADAALLVSLPAGQYSAVVSSSDGGTGEALVEVYEMP